MCLWGTFFESVTEKQLYEYVQKFKIYRNVVMDRGRYGLKNIQSVNTLFQYFSN
jgi:hypothetical protein